MRKALCKMDNIQNAFPHTLDEWLCKIDFSSCKILLIFAFVKLIPDEDNKRYFQLRNKDSYS